MSSGRRFALDLGRIADAIGDDLDTVARRVVIELFSGVIRDTRVDTGRLRGNWQTSIGAPITGETDRLDRLPQGSDGGQAMGDVERVVESGEINYLTNNLPYAEVWEERDGMVARNVERLERTVSEEAARVRR